MSHEKRPSNAKAATSPATRMVLAALVVAVVALVWLADSVEVAVVMPAVVPAEVAAVVPEAELLVLELLVLELLAGPMTPPKMFAGTVESLAFAAAALNKARVSCPPELQENELQSTASG